MNFDPKDLENLDEPVDNSSVSVLEEQPTVSDIPVLEVQPTVSSNPVLEIQPTTEAPAIQTPSLEPVQVEDKPLIQTEPPHVSLDHVEATTPRVFFQTSVNQPGQGADLISGVPDSQKPKPKPAPTIKPKSTPEAQATPTLDGGEKAVQKNASEKSSLFPVIMIILIIIGGAYIVLTNLNKNKVPYTPVDDSTYVEEDEEENNEEIKEDVKKETKEDTKEENKEEAKTQSGEIEMTPGTALYLASEGDSIEMNGVKVELVSKTDNKLVVNVTIKEATKKYDVVLNEETKFEGLKNAVTFKLEKDNISVNFK